MELEAIARSVTWKKFLDRPDRVAVLPDTLIAGWTKYGFLSATQQTKKAREHEVPDNAWTVGSIAGSIVDIGLFGGSGAIGLLYAYADPETTRTAIESASIMSLWNAGMYALNSVGRGIYTLASGKPVMSFWGFRFWGLVSYYVLQTAGDVAGVNVRPVAHNLDSATSHLATATKQAAKRVAVTINMHKPYAWANRPVSVIAAEVGEQGKTWYRRTRTSIVSLLGYDQA